MLGRVSDKAFWRGDISQLVCTTIRHTDLLSRPVWVGTPRWPQRTLKSCWLPLSPGAPSAMPGDPVRALTEHTCSCKAARLCLKALKYEVTLRLTTCPKAPLLHTAQTPAPQEAIPLGHEDGEGKTLGLGGMGKQESMMFLSGIWKASAREFRCLQNHLLSTSKQTKVDQCPNYIG